MAMMIDKKPEYKGEGKVWESLSDNLPGEAIVYNSREINGREFDFCILMKNVGMIIIEVKGWLADSIFDEGYMPEQVQDFYPTPSTISTCMYYTGYDCRTMEKVYVPTNPHEKAMQRALIQYRNPKNYDLVVEALKIAGRTDLIGYDKRCLVRPRGGNGGNAYGQKAESGFHESRGSQGRSQKPSKEKPKKTIRNLHKRKTK